MEKERKNQYEEDVIRNVFSNTDISQFKQADKIF